MPNQNTIVDALRVAGIPTETAPILTNPGGNNPWLFTWPASSVANAGVPVVLDVPIVQGEAIDVGALAGHNQATDQEWYADRAMFLVRVLGRVQPVAFAKTLKLYLFAGNGLASGSAGSIQDFQLGLLSATLPAASTNAASTNWFIEAKCLWDSTSLSLTGSVSGVIGGTVISATGFSVVNPTAYAYQQAPGSYNPLAFVVGANLASTSALPAGTNDILNLDEFTAEML